MRSKTALLFLSLGVTFSAAAWFDKDDAWVASRKGWWAFKRPVKAAVPDLRDSWIRTPVDAFVLEMLRDRKIRPSSPIDKPRLIRRLTLDLTGLPPSPAEVRAFLADTGSDAYENLVDRLLKSPQYGERWAVKWLDVVRYADTNGYEGDAERPHAWRYRDYVVKSFNDGKPFDRFVKEQLAGDELFSEDLEALIATGFHRAGPIHVVGGMKDEEMERQEVLTEMTGAIGSVYLGLTIGCARCHNHKFDPIPQADYYRLQAVLAATEAKDVSIANAEQKEAYAAAVKAHQARLKPIKDLIAEIEKPYNQRLREAKVAKLDPKLREALEAAKEQRNETQKRLAKDAEAQVKVPWYELVAAIPEDQKARRAELRRQMHAIDQERPAALPAVFAIINKEKAPPTYVLKVGNHKMKLDEVGPGLLRVLDPPSVPSSPAGRRSALAGWIASPEHPLTARVMVNRIWQLRMGTGLVATPNDFGLLGARPSNQKLLDWLAVEFIERGWSIKAIDRMILL
jgi:hypothetical protein